MSKKQTSVSPSSTESEVFFYRCRSSHRRYTRSWISGTWLLMLHSSLTQPRAQGNLCRDTQSEIRSKARTKTHFKPLGDLGLRNVDFVTSNGKLSRFGACFILLKTVNAATKMISKGRSPTVRHVSRTHRELPSIGYFTE